MRHRNWAHRNAESLTPLATKSPSWRVVPSRGSVMALCAVLLLAAYGATAAVTTAAAQPAPVVTGFWTEIPNPNYAPPVGPYARAWTEMTWDSLRQEIVIFGGNGPNQYDNDIWSFNSMSSTWTNLAAYTHCPGNDG